MATNTLEAVNTSDQEDTKDQISDLDGRSSPNIQPEYELPRSNSVVPADIMPAFYGFDWTNEYKVKLISDKCLKKEEPSSHFPEYNYGCVEKHILRLEVHKQHQNNDENNHIIEQHSKSSIHQPSLNRCETGPKIQTTTGWFAANPKTQQKVSGKKQDVIKNVFISLKVKRLSDIDNVKQTFRMRFHVYFNWIMTVEDYISYLNFKYNNNLRIWKPYWYPHIEFENSVEEHVNEWQYYPEFGEFRFEDYKQKNHEETILKDAEFNVDDAHFIRAKKEFDITFAEELELKWFPLDCQDLTCMIQERSSTNKDVTIRFLPEFFLSKQFCQINPKYSLINEWKLKKAMLELGTTKSSRTAKSNYPSIELRLKMERVYSVYLYRIASVIFFICALSLVSFAVDFSDSIGDRLGLIETLLLTAVAFSYIVFEHLPNIPYVTFLECYILGGYLYCAVVMILSACLEKIEQVHENGEAILGWVLAGVFSAYQLGFWTAGYIGRKKEKEKLHYTSQEIKDKVNASHPSITLKHDEKEKKPCTRIDILRFEAEPDVINIG